MTSIKILIVEDELIIADDLRDILSNQYEVVSVCKTYATALLELEKQQIDLILLDIKLKGEKDGIDLARVIREDYRIPFVFISSHSDRNTVQRAVEVNPYGYLIKPFEDNDVLVAIEVALSNFGKEQSTRIEDFLLNDALFVRHKNLSIKIMLTDIEHIKAEGNYSTIYTIDQKQYVLRGTLKEIETKLPTKQFYRIHKSYIINLSQLSAINTNGIYVNEKKLPIGREQLHYLMENINKA